MSVECETLRNETDAEGFIEVEGVEQRRKAQPQRRLSTIEEGEEPEDSCAVGEDPAPSAGKL